MQTQNILSQVLYRMSRKLWNVKRMLGLRPVRIADRRSADGTKDRKTNRYSF